LMAYLQCREDTPNHHSFVYFRKSATDWHFVGSGFDLDPQAMPQAVLRSYIAKAKAKTDCQAPTVKKNVYGEALEECRVGNDMMGSWQDDGTCSEQVGGIHEICIEKLPADFSEATHQPAWSRGRAGKRHCVCIGAWSLYMTDASKHPADAAGIMPHCKSIPETALTSRYLSNWKDWNGYVANVVSGVGELVNRCLHQESDADMKCALVQRFHALQKEVPELHDAASLEALQVEIGQLHCSKV